MRVPRLTLRSSIKVRSVLPCSLDGSLHSDGRDAPQSKSDSFRVELELASINQRLDHLTTLITTVVSGIGVSPGSAVSLTQREEDRFSDEEKAPFELLVSRSIMRALDLDPNFMTELAMLERGVISNGSNGSHRFCIVQTQQAVR